MKNLPPLNGLRAFDAAGRHLTFRAASEELGVTQGAVAQQVRGLEAHLGVSLFERLPKGLAFTAAGRSYHARVAEAFGELREATEVLRPGPAKVLISVTPTFASKWLIPNLPRLTASHPDIDLRILATERISSFRADGIDLAVRQGAPPFGASVDAHLLFRQEIVAVASPNLLGGRRLPLGSDALQRLPKLHDTHDLWPAFLAAAGTEDDGARGLRLNQTSLAIDAALAGQGLALASRFLVARDIVAGRLLQVVPETLTGEGDFYLLVKRGPRRGAAAARVVDWMRAAAEAADSEA